LREGKINIKIWRVGKINIKIWIEGRIDGYKDVDRGG